VLSFFRSIEEEMVFDALIFDLDGTLLDTIEDIADSMNAALEHIDCPGHSIDTYKSFIGDGIELLVKRSLPEEMRDDQTISMCIDNMRREYGRRWSHSSRPFDGIPELLDGLEGKGIKMSILSNKLDAFTKEMVKGLLGSWQFHSVMGLTSGVPRKPDPACAIKIAQNMHVEPGRCIFVGDSGIDMMTAVNGGMYPVGVLWGYQNREKLISSGAVTLLSDPLDLLELFNE
jgi:phosphoglycolate phosphatase